MIRCAAFRWGKSFVDLRSAQADVLGAEQCECLSRCAIPARTADFLIVGLDRFRQVCVGHPANVRFVDAHAESDRCNNNQPIFALEPGFDPATVVRVHAAMVMIRGMAGIAQQILIECRNVLPLGWFQFELLTELIGEEPGDADGSRARSWSAGPDGVLFEGEPEPPARPEMLPGIHRRASWRKIRAPLEAEGELLAMVRLWCDPRRFEPGAEKLFTTLVPQMASSVHRARLDREAKLDPLTGVPVRRILESSLQKAYRQCFEEGQSMAVIMCDIDFFKKVNDVHGHAAGDDALKLVAHTLASQRREGDLCCRYGGEEFTLLLEKTDGPSALQLAERLRAAVESLALVYEERPIPLTLSLGVAAFPEVHIKTASELLLLADEALYQCKERGRNQCLLYLGNHRFQGPGGEVVAREVPEAVAAAPRIFG